MAEGYIIGFGANWMIELATVLLLGAYVISVVVKRAAVSKPKLPPGPKGLPLVGYLPFLGREPHKKLYSMTKKYGDMIGLYFGPNFTIVLNEHNVAKEVLCHLNALDRAPGTFDHVPTGFLTSNGPEWMEQRKFCVNAIRDIGLGTKEWEDIINDEIDGLSAKVRCFGGKPVDIGHMVSNSISSSILALLIGRKLTEKHDGDKRQLSVDFVEAAVRYMDPASPACMVPGLRRLLEVCHIAGHHESAAVIQKFVAFIRKEISNHMSCSDSRGINDFINVYLNKLQENVETDKKDHFFSEDMLMGNLNILYLASSDTLFSTIMFFIRIMAKHQDIQQKMYDEIKKVLGAHSRARYAEKDELPYSFAVIMEVTRFTSIVPLSGPRRCNEDIQINDYTIPKGSNITLNTYAVHNDPRYWKNPERFVPERFLDGEGNIVKNPPSFAPFTYGKRNCPGEAVAWMELLCYCSEFVRNFHITPPTGQEVKFDDVVGIVIHLKPQELCFKLR